MGGKGLGVGAGEEMRKGRGASIAASQDPVRKWLCVEVDITMNFMIFHVQQYPIATWHEANRYFFNTFGAFKFYIWRIFSEEKWWGFRPLHSMMSLGWDTGWELEFSSSWNDTCAQPRLNHFWQCHWQKPWAHVCLHRIRAVTEHVTLCWYPRSSKIYNVAFVSHWLPLSAPLTNRDKRSFNKERCGWLLKVTKHGPQM